MHAAGGAPYHVAGLPLQRHVMAVEAVEYFSAGLEVDRHAIQFVIVRLAVPLIDRRLIVLEGLAGVLRDHRAGSSEGTNQSAEDLGEEECRRDRLDCLRTDPFDRKAARRAGCQSARSLPAGSDSHGLPSCQSGSRSWRQSWLRSCHRLRCPTAPSQNGTRGGRRISCFRSLLQNRSQSTRR